MGCAMLSTVTIQALVRAARRSASPQEAEDLVQEVLLSAFEKKHDCADPAFLAWASGAIRNSGRFSARTAARRLRREHAYAIEHASRLEHERSDARPPRFSSAFLAALPRSRRVVALLINLGMGRREIAYLLGLSDVALRQRVAGVRAAFAAFAGDPEGGSAPVSSLDGPARRALKASLPRRHARRFGVRDPDGLPIFFAVSDHALGTGGNSPAGPTSKGAPDHED